MSFADRLLLAGFPQRCHSYYQKIHLLSMVLWIVKRFLGSDPLQISARYLAHSHLGFLQLIWVANVPWYSYHCHQLYFGFLFILATLIIIFYSPDFSQVGFITTTLSDTFGIKSLLIISLLGSEINKYLILITKIFRLDWRGHSNDNRSFYFRNFKQWVSKIFFKFSANGISIDFLWQIFSIRGRLGSIIQLSRNIGILISYIIGAVVDYKYIPCIFIFIPILYVVCFIFLPNTPQFYLHKQQTQVSI